METFRRRETLECGGHGRIQAQGLVDHTVQVVSILEFLIVDVSRRANVLRYLFT